MAFGLGVVLSFAAQRPWSEVARVDGDAVMRGLPRDAIPAIDRPVFVEGRTARFMRADEYVIGVVDGMVAKAYSTWQLNAHEIVNDTLQGRPIAVTWCPLCFTGIVYDRRVAGRALTFGVSGMLWRENLVMYDRETDSWWTQAGGRAIHGPLEGQALTQVAASMTTWKEWLARHPDTLLLSKQTERGIEGRDDSYATYHAARDTGVTGRLRRQRTALDPKTRVLGFRLSDGGYATVLSALERAKVIVTRAGREPVVLASSRDGSGGRVFRAGEHIFTVTVSGVTVDLVDAGTGSRWDPFEGRAVSGRLAGAWLEEIPSSLAYWFAWHAFLPQTELVPPPK